MSLDASEITLGDICEALQVDIVKAAWRSGSMVMDCMIASGMAGVMDGIYAELDEICKKRLKGITIQDVEKKVAGCKK